MATKSQSFKYGFLASLTRVVILDPKWNQWSRVERHLQARNRMLDTLKIFHVGVGGELGVDETLCF